MKPLNTATLIAMIFGAAVAHGASTIQLRGTVPTNCTVSVSSNARATTLPIVDGGSILVGQLEETCNFAGGYTIKASSLSGSKLVNTANSSLSTTYTVSVENGLSDVTLGTSATPVRTVGAMTTPVVGLTKNLTVNIAALAGALGGNYEDTVTFTISAP